MAILPHIDEENDSSWPQEMIFYDFLVDQSILFWSKSTFQRQREMNIDRVRIKRKSNDFYRNQSTIFETSDTGHALSRHEEAQRRREVCSILYIILY